MNRLRFLIDDAPACHTQRAVLADFAARLPQAAHGSLEVLWSSALRGLPAWPDVPAESSRRLAVRLAALAPQADTVTVFLPAHTVPGPVEWPPAGELRPAQALASEGVTAVADLDLFVIDNASPQAAALHAHLLAHPGYESASRHEAFTPGPLPAWLVGGGLSSARLFTRRPWYSAHAPQRQAWLEAVGRSLDAGRLTLAMVADDVRHHRVRPSLREEVSALRGEPLPAGGADLTLDALFIPPERRLPPAQRALLHSRALQRRNLAFARRNGERKGSRGRRRSGWVASAWGPLSRHLRQAWRQGRRLGWRVLHAAYAASLRPLVHRLRAPGGARP